MSQLPRGEETSRASGIDLRLLGLPAALAGVGVHDLPATVRDRVELSPAARGADPDDTRRPEVRLLYVEIVVVLRNLWVWLHYTILSRPRRGGRVILLERLRWETLLLWLLHVVEEAFGVADVTYTERDVQYELAS